MPTADRLFCDEVLADNDSRPNTTLSDGSCPESGVATVGYIVFVSIIIIVGGLGNLLVLICVCCDRTIRSVSNCLIAHLSLVDLLVCAVILPVHLAGLLSNQNLAFCGFSAVINPLLPIMSLHSQCFIAVNRYVLVTKSKPIYRSWFRWKRTSFVVAIIWIVDIFIFVLLPAILSGWRLTFVPYIGLCIVDLKLYFGSIVMPLGPLISFILAFICYGKLIFYVKQHSFALNFAKRKDVRVSIVLFLVLVLFLLSFVISPSFILSMKEDVDPRMRYAALEPLYIVIWCNFCINPIVYGLTTHEFKRTYARVLCPCTTRSRCDFTIQGIALRRNAPISPVAPRRQCHALSSRSNSQTQLEKLEQSCDDKAQEVTTDCENLSSSFVDNLGSNSHMHESRLSEENSYLVPGERPTEFPLITKSNLETLSMKYLEVDMVREGYNSTSCDISSLIDLRMDDNYSHAGGHCDLNYSRQNMNITSEADYKSENIHIKIYPRLCFGTSVGSPRKMARAGRRRRLTNRKSTSQQVHRYRFYTNYVSP